MAEFLKASDSSYRKYFGFTREEIADMTQYYGCTEKYSEIQSWYNGYNFGGIEIYNPWSIIKYIRSGCLPAPYWLSTSSNELIYQLVESCSDDVKKVLKDLLDGKQYSTELNTQIIYPKIFDNYMNLFSFLVMTGYLRAQKQEYVAGYYNYSLCIPNREIAYVYKKVR